MIVLLVFWSLDCLSYVIYTIPTISCNNVMLKGKNLAANV